MAATPAAIAALRREITDVRRREAELRRQADSCGAEAARMEAALAEAEAQRALAEAEAQRALTVAFWTGGGSLLAGVTDDTLACIASFLPSARDLLSLGLACTRLSARSIAAPPPRAGATAAAAVPVSTVAATTQAPVAAGSPETSSIIEEAAHRWITGCTDQERGWVPRRGRESWLGLMWEVESLRRGAKVFGRSHASITVSEGGALATKGVLDGKFRSTASKAVMRAGRHYTQFTVMNGSYTFCGVIRPGWDVGGGGAHHVDGHCFYYTYSGFCFPGNRNWEGRQSAQKEGDRIGMLLDLDQGTMTVYKNDERLGVMATGLSDEYCWAVTLFRGDSARIDAAAAPASPTAEELAQAVAYEAEQADDN